jgi:hypothetical protein
MSIGLPRLDSETDYSDQIRAGDVVQIADGITFVPAPGWALTTGALVGETHAAVGSTQTTELVHGSATFFVRAAPFAGTPAALLARINQLDADLHGSRARAAGTTRRYSVKTDQGDVGVAEDFAGVAREGTVIAFVFPTRNATGSQRVGVEVVAAGPVGEMSRRRDDVVAMIRSIRKVR